MFVALAALAPKMTAARAKRTRELTALADAERRAEQMAERCQQLESAAASKDARIALRVRGRGGEPDAELRRARARRLEMRTTYRF